MKRLGPQDPLSWIKDTSEKSTNSGEKTQELQGIRRISPGEKRTFRIQSEGETPVEVTVIIKGEGEDRTVCVKVAEQGRQKTKVEVNTSDKLKEEE
jgi:hypothetical protein